jgi:hypothetical protein
MGIACIITLASSAYDEFISWIWDKGRGEASMKIITGSNFDSNIHQAMPLKFMVRGYDSPELFREDLWLRRIEQARREHIAVIASMPLFKGSTEAGHDYQRRVCSMLAQHRGARCDN